VDSVNARHKQKRQDSREVPMKLHGYFRSSASYRVRIALNLKGLSADHLPHHLRKGEQRDPAYLRSIRKGWFRRCRTTRRVITVARHHRMAGEASRAAAASEGSAASRQVRAFAMALACDTPQDLIWRGCAIRPAGRAGDRMGGMGQPQSVGLRT
jgi:hypothetical protein